MKQDYERTIDEATQAAVQIVSRRTKQELLEQNANLLKRVAEERKDLLQRTRDAFEAAAAVARDNLFLKRQANQMTHTDYTQALNGCYFSAAPSDADILRASEIIRKVGNIKEWREAQFERKLLGQVENPELRGVVDRMLQLGAEGMTSLEY